MAYGADVRRALVQLFVHCGDRDRSSVGYYRGFRPQKKTSGMELQVQGIWLSSDRPEACSSWLQRVFAQMHALLARQRESQITRYITT